MRRRRWVFLLLCLFIVSLLCFQLSQASATLRVNEAATRFLLEEGFEAAKHPRRREKRISLPPLIAQRPPGLQPLRIGRS